MSDQYVLTAHSREERGTAHSRRLRNQDQVPAVMYGAGKQNIALALNHTEMYRYVGVEAFHTALLDLNVDGKSEQVILRDVQMHPFKPLIMHLDFQRVSATEKLHIKVPVHIVGGDVSPGVKAEGGIVSHLITELDISCLPKDLPEYLEIDISELELHQSVHLSDIKIPDGVELTALAHGGEDLAVAGVAPAKVIEEDIEEVEEGEVVEGEGEVVEGEGEGEVKDKAAEAEKPGKGD